MFVQTYFGGVFHVKLFNKIMRLPIRKEAKSPRTYQQMESYTLWLTYVARHHLIKLCEEQATRRLQNISTYYYTFLSNSVNLHEKIQFELLKSKSNHYTKIQ